MRQVVLLIYPGVTIGQLTGMAEVFRFANELARFLRPAAPRYQLSYFQFGDSDSYRMDGVQIDCIKQLPEQIDALLIPGSYAHQASELAAQISYLPIGAAGLCVGGCLQWQFWLGRHRLT